ncbi:MAG: dihydrodipicolinate reductase [Gemmatimonadota bacterium]|nr:dihydrodipicolinate reductase [Gemmatimonadota bacterium]
MTVPRLAIIGTGKMGRLVAGVAEERGWPVVATIGAEGNAGGRAITRDRLAGAQVAIEFTEPQSAADNVLACVRAGCAVVCGTTGWSERRSEVARAVTQAGGALFWAANFAVGVNLFWLAAEQLAASIAAASAGFSPHIVETHHAAKKDAPSGTALELQRRASVAGAGGVPVTSVRVGSVPGTHELLFDAPYEQIRLEHVARDRRVFAEGALAAAEWIVGRSGVFGMADLLARPASTSHTTPS